MHDGPLRSYAVGPPKDPKTQSSTVEILLFTPTTDAIKGLAMSSLLLAATDANPTGEVHVPVSPIAGIPTRLACHILDLDFVEMCDLLPDSWQDETQQLLVLDSLQLAPRRLSRKAPVQDISLWIECFSRMVAVLVTRYPDKVPEMFSYQASIVKAAQNFEGTSWVAYDRQYRREALAHRDLNWSRIDSRLYSEAFTERAKAIPRCKHCLSDTHLMANCSL